MKLAIRKTVADAKGFCIWAASAPVGDFAIYHIGELGRDRINNPELHELAETVLILCNTGYIVSAQYPMRLAHINGWSYVATRSRGGWAPRAFLRREINSTEYLALNALRHRDAAMSAPRTVRDALSCPDSVASDMLTYLHQSGWVEEAPGKGWSVSATGLRMLV